ncbi:MAG TPA: MFS transporter [Microbacteriaceae bacterium]|nr:MFS transporter [Microbacteriaceae bacterium]HQX35088.1 MFS transporter [Microbacteriaceae bacterium]HQZ47655.1 MFS transporter [Microbacteriaceae bacterium]HRA09376.1 MFS transporter [Microbacteriaceae bacterium]
MTADSSGNILMRFAPMIYGPTVLFTLGEGAVIPLFPVIAARLGADLAVAALVAAALVVGQLFGNVPAGWAVARIGERLTMTFAGLAGILGVVAMVFATSVGMLMASVFIIGFCASAFGLARHSFMTTRVPLAFRARALALLGGSWRLGMFVGPFVAAAILLATGNEQIVMWFFGGCLLACVALVFFGPDPEEQLQAEASAARRAMDATTPTEFELEAEDLMLEDTGEVSTGSIPTFERQGVFATMWANRRVLSRVGVAAATLSSVRAARTAMLPLWGLAIGLDAEHIALIVGISGAIDFALFYASGQIMDRFGRIWAVLPSMIAMGLGFIVLAFTQEFTGPVIWFIALSAFLALGNGLSSGILLTLGADLAPQHDPAPFLGAWRTLTDAGGAVTPLAVAGIIGVASITWASGLVGVVGLVGAVMFARWLPKYMPHK